MGGRSRGELQVRAARVAGVEIPNNKRAETALTYVYGIGNTTAHKIMNDTGLENKRVREFEEEELTTLRAEVDKWNHDEEAMQEQLAAALAKAAQMDSLQAEASKLSRNLTEASRMMARLKQDNSGLVGQLQDSKGQAAPCCLNADSQP